MNSIEKLMRAVGYIVTAAGSVMMLIWMFFSKTSILTSNDITMFIAVFVFAIGLLFIGLGYFWDPKVRLTKVGYVIWLLGLGLVTALALIWVVLIAANRLDAGSVMGAILGGTLGVACLLALTAVGPMLMYVVKKEKREISTKGGE